MTNRTLDALYLDLARARRRLEHFGNAINRVWWSSTRRELMSLKDDVKAGLDAAMAGVRKEQDREKAERDTIAALQTQTAAMAAHIAELEAQPGPYTDADMAEIKGQVQALNDALNPDAVVADITANTA